MVVYPILLISQNAIIRCRNCIEKISTHSEIFSLAKKLGMFGPLWVIDLDALDGKNTNEKLIQEIVTVTPCYLGNAVSSIESAQFWLQKGAQKLVLQPDTSLECIQSLVAVTGKENLVMSLNSVKNCKVVIQSFEPFCSEFVYEDRERSGTLSGVNWPLVQSLQFLSKNPITFSGGISSPSDVKKLHSLGLNAGICAMLWEFNFDLPQFIVPLLQFKDNNLIVTIAQDVHSKDVVKIGYSNPDSIKKTFETGRGWYWSRARKKLAMKGEQSGNVQEIVRILYDCDCDALLFLVRQKGIGACHLQRWSCFGEKQTDFTYVNSLYSTLQDRIRSHEPKSYTVELTNNEKLLHEKLLEEIQEVIEADEKKDVENLEWEIADALYFLLVTAAKNNISLSRVGQRLEKRHERKQKGLPKVV